MSEHDHEHHPSLSIYFAVFATLMVLTGMTVWVAFIQLGALGDIVAITIATIKATLVMLFFMHLKYSEKLTWVVMIAAFVWLAVLLGITLSDYLSRGWLGFPGT